MSNTWFNLRILFWHFQISKGRLFHMGVYYNPHWYGWRGLKSPVALYAFSPLIGWRERKNYQWWMAQGPQPAEPL